MRKVLPTFGLLLLLASAVPASAQDGPHRVLVLHSFRGNLPVNADWEKGIARGFTSASELQLEIDVEAPDLSRIQDADYASNLLDVYRRKYQHRDSKPHLIIPTYTLALNFLLDHGEDLFPGVPIVFLGADARYVAARKLAPHVTGITSRPDIGGTLKLALHVHPDAQRVAVIVGSGGIGRLFKRDARQQLQPHEGRVEFVWLEGLPLDELTDAVKKLPSRTVILYLVALEDRTGKRLVPVSHLPELSAAANAPIYGLWDTLLASGIIGGSLVTLEEDGFQAAQMGVRILKGEAPAAVPIIDKAGNSAIFHAKELARWDIDASRLPAGSRILHRELSLWDRYRTEVIIALLVIGLQGLLILALLLNRARLKRTQAALQAEQDRRTLAEIDSRKSGIRLARFSRQRSLGTMATTVAHEISQPLISIQNYAQAARRRVQGGGDQAPKLDELLGKIEHQAGRAGDTIQRIRALVSTDSAVLRPVSLNSLLEQVMQMMRPDFETRNCVIQFSPAADLPEVLADELQIQLVIVNLLQNAVQSMEAAKDQAERVASIETRQVNDQEVQIGVADRGSGISTNAAKEIFEPLYSEKSGGMGMGLAVCRAIIEAHGGRIWYTPNPSGGAIFRFTLRPTTA